MTTPIVAPQRAVWLITILYHGSDGYSIFGGASDVPAYAQLSTSGASEWTWGSSAGDSRGLQTFSGSTGRIEATDYSPTSFSFNLDLTDGQSHQVALYLLDYDPLGRTETVQITSTGIGTVLDTRNVSNFGSGQWLVWDLSGAVTITITNTGTGPQNAVASGIFFDPAGTTTIKPASASYVTTDTSTQGTWTGVYGSDGYSIFGGANTLPSNVQLSTMGASQWIWGSGSDPRGLQTSSGSSNLLDACDYSATSFSLTLNLTDGQSHQVALYLLDYDNLSRNETVTITNTATGAVLDTRTVSNFSNGQWLVWNVTGEVTITLTNNGAQNAVASGIFIG